MRTALLVTVGAAVGAPARLLVGHWLRVGVGATPTGGTLCVNVIGSLLLGLLVGAAVTGDAMALVGVGFCGALTTFSTLALEIWDAAQDDRALQGAVLMALHLVLGMGAAWLGWLLGR